LINKNFLVNGSEQRSKTEQGSNIRYNWSKKIAISTKGITGQLNNESAAFDNRNYRINYWSVEPNLSITPNKTTRISTSFKYKFGEDTLPEPNSRTPAIINQLTSELRLGSAIKNALTAKFSYAIIRYEGGSNTSVAYNLLDGLQAGNNFIWSATYNTRLSGNIQLNLSYDGRKSGDSRINHVGRASVRAIF